MEKLTLILLILIFSFCKAQDTFKGCPMGGDRKNSMSQDSLKNRWVIPDCYDSIDLKILLNAKSDSLQINAPIKITGYVLEVKDGGLESTNCHSKIYKDTHIYIVDTPTEKSKSSALIIEVTPRLREYMAQKLIDWSTQNLKKVLTGKKVVISGFSFNDREHKPASKADNPNGTHLWRKSCYEAHPVTDIQIL